jgi:hypothetical protein
MLLALLMLRLLIGGAAIALGFVIFNGGRAVYVRTNSGALCFISDAAALGSIFGGVLILGGRLM